MRRRPSSRWAFLWTVLLLTAGRGAARADRPVGGELATAWRDAKVLEARFAEACDAVEKATGKPFARRPTVKVSTTEAVVEVLKVEMAPEMKAIGESEALPGVLDLLAGGLIAKYEPATGIVHVLPGSVEHLAKILKEPGLLTEETLRAVLAHECTHAHDFGIYDWRRMSVERTTLESHKALNAIIEGHAQLVAEEITAGTDLAPAFALFTKAITATPTIEDPTLKQVVSALTAEVGFAYVEGHAFLKAVKAAQGAAGVERALVAPPESMRQIERPELWLDPKAATNEVDLEALLETLRPVVGDPAWHVRNDRILEASLEAMRSSIPEARRVSYLTGYANGRMLAATVQGDPAQVMLMALAFATPEDAKAHLDLERDLSHAQDEAMKKDGGFAHLRSATYEEGAGPGSVLPGFRVAKLLDVFGNEQTVDTAMAAIDRVVVQVVAMIAPEIDRAVQDEAVARAAAFVRDPAAARTLPPLSSRPHRKVNNLLVVRVLDGDGKPVPKARAMLVDEGATSAKDMDAPPASTAMRMLRASQSTDVRDGRAVFARVRRTVTVEVWGAQSDDGTPLPWAPAHREHVARDAGEVEIRLEPGAAISGHVRTQDGKGVADIEVTATPREDSFRWRDDPLSTTTTDADGAFRLVGLGTETCLVKVASSAELAAPPSVEARGGDTSLEIVVKPR